MVYNLCLPWHLQPLHQTQHEIHARISPVKLRTFDHAKRRVLKHLLELGLRSVRDEERSAVYQTKSLGALKVKAVEELVSMILATSTACQESHLSTISGKGYSAPNVRADGFGTTHF